MNVNIFITDFNCTGEKQENWCLLQCYDAKGWKRSRALEYSSSVWDAGKSPKRTQAECVCCGMRSEITIRHAGFDLQSQMLFYLFVVAKIKPKPASVLTSRALVLLARQRWVNHSPRSFFTLCPSKKL